MYKINFEKIKQSSTDFKGKDWLTPREIIRGVHWDISDIPLEHVQYIPKDKYKHVPIVCIDESIRDHMTQIYLSLKKTLRIIILGLQDGNLLVKNLYLLYVKEKKIFIRMIGQMVINLY